MNSLFPDICSDAIAESKEFYTSLLGFKTVFAIDWYVQLRSPTDANLQIAFVRRDHDSVPAEFREPPRGVIITVETDHVDALYERARRLGGEIVLGLRDEVWGQRHFMVRDPNGLLVDLVQMIEPTRDFLEAHGLA